MQALRKAKVEVVRLLLSLEQLIWVSYNISLLNSSKIHTKLPVLMMLDATKPDVHRQLLTNELESVGIRLNKQKPNIYFKIKKGGGLSFNSTCALTKCNEKMVQTILHSFKMFNAEVLFRDDCTTDEFIDVVVGNRVYLPCIYVYNKIDQISIEEVNRLARQPHSKRILVIF